MIARHGRTISFEALNDMPVLHRNIQEAIRLHPPLILLLRQVHKDFTVTTSKGKTYLIPKVTPFAGFLSSISFLLPLLPDMS